MYVHCILGYDPVNSMQGLDISQQQQQPNYMDPMDMGAPHSQQDPFQQMDSSGLPPAQQPQQPPPPGQPQQQPDQNQMAAWFDTDL